MPDLERIPLFPLGVVLLPQEVLPLHIFEERYKLLTRYCLKEETVFGLLHTDEEGLKSVGCTARIRSVVKEYDDETIDIETVGETRFRVVGLYNDLPYTTADVVLLTGQDDPAVATDRERLVAQHMKLMEMLGETIRPNAYEDPHELSFRIGATAGLDVEQRQELLEIDREAARITYLVKHLEDFIPRVQSVRERRERVRSNGHFN